MTPTFGTSLVFCAPPGYTLITFHNIHSSPVWFTLNSDFYPTLEKSHDTCNFLKRSNSRSLLFYLSNFWSSCCPYHYQVHLYCDVIWAAFYSPLELSLFHCKRNLRNGNSFKRCRCSRFACSKQGC